jgi:glycosyltransferase involved in cell wall biosynthesis
MWHLARAQQALGARVTVLTGEPGVVPESNDPQPRLVATGTTDRARHALRSVRWILRHRPAVVHLHSRPEIGNGLAAARFTGLRALSFDYPLLYPRWLQGAARGYRCGLGHVLAASADLFLPVTDFAAVSLGRLGVSLPAARTRVLWNGTDLPPEGAGLPARDERTVLFVGRFVDQKGARLFSAAAAAMPDRRFVTVGPHGAFGTTAVPDPELPNLHHEGPLPDREVTERIRSAGCLVLPTQAWEVFGMVLVEALAQGTPVVTTRADGPAEILRDAPGVRFCERGDLDSLVTAIAHACTVDDDERRAARSFARRFGWPAIAAASLVLYRSARERRG